MDSIRVVTADDLEREEIDDARRMPLEVRLVMGVVLFDRCLKSMEAGVRLLHPQADDAAVHAMIEQRLQLARASESLD